MSSETEDPPDSVERTVESEPPRRTPRPWHRPARMVRETLSERGDLLAVIAAGGALGSLARWGIAELLPHRPDQVGVSTWTVNLTGGLLLGVLMTLILEVWPPTRYVRPFLGVGVLGGYTTFSTYMLDTRDLLAAGRPDLAALYLFGTLVSGLVAVWLGVTLVRTGLIWIRNRRGAR